MKRVSSRIAGLLSLFASCIAMAAPGDPDPTFGVGGVQLIDFGGSASVMITGVAQQWPGKIIVTGRVPDPASSSGRIAIGRLNADGTTDSTFGTAGWVMMGQPSYDFSPLAVGVDPGGNIVVFGKERGYTFIATMDRDGANSMLNGISYDYASQYEMPRAIASTPSGNFILVGACDTPPMGPGRACAISYGAGGYRIGRVDFALPGSGEARAIAADPSGSGGFFVAGYADVGPNNRDMFVTKMDGNLATDPSFGLRTIDFGARDEATAIGFRNYGHVIVAGSSGNGAESQLATVSLSVFDGTIDQYAWGFDGRALMPASFNGGPATITPVSVVMSFTTLPDGVYVVSTVRTSDPAYPQPSRMVITRLDHAGSPYAGFGLSGTSETPNAPGDADVAVAALELPSSQILSIGTRLAPGALIAAKHDLFIGALDATFGNGGVSTARPYLPTQDQLSALALAPGGGYVGIASGNSGMLHMFRTTADGILDGSFGNGGAVLLPYGSYQIAAQPDGRIITTHEFASAGRVLLAVERWTPEGAPDLSFGSSGSVSIDLGGAGTNGSGIAIGPDLKIVLALTAVIGSPSRIRMAVARLNPNGSLDTSFAGGTVVLDNSADEEARGVALQPDGRVTIGGTNPVGFMVYRVLPNGARDLAWGSAGSAIIADCMAPQVSSALALAPDGGVAVIGNYGSAHACFGRLTPSGLPDASFGPQGLQAHPITTTSSSGEGVTVDTAGRVVGAISAGSPALVRLALDGSLDMSFGVSGLASIQNLASGMFGGVLRQYDDRLVAWGTANLFGDPDGLIARFQGGGVLAQDTTPDPFAFANVTGVPLATMITSNAVTITGITAPAPISVANGGMSIGCGSTFDSNPTTILNGQTVCLRHFSASTAGTSVTTTLTVGGVSATFVSTTAMPLDTTITGMPPNPSTSAGATFTFTSSDPAATIRFECMIDGGPWGGCTSPRIYSVPQGSHTFQVRAVSSVGPDPTPASYTWQVNLTQPDTTITSGPSDPTPIASTSATFTFTSNEAGATFQCSLDNAPYAACASPTTYDNLLQGGHLFNVRAVGSGGTLDPTPARRIFTVDTTPPETTITSGIPPQQTNATSATFAFTSNDPNATFQCRIDNLAFAACTSPATYGGLADGNHSFFVRATDLAGNTDPSAASAFWTVDTIAPDTTLTTYPPSLATTNGASFSFTSSEAFSTFECSLDAAPYAACAFPVGYGDLAQGAHTFAVRAIDRAGNADASPATYGWTIDSVPSDTTITSGPTSNWASTSATFVIVASEPGATLQCSLDGAGYSACTSPVTYSGLAQGLHTFAARAIDAAGNIDPSPAFSAFTVDLTPPDTSIDSAPSAMTSSQNAAFTFSSTDGAAQFECALDGGSYAACASPRTYSALSEGLHTFQVRAVDAAGNVDATPAQHQWTVDVTAPETVVTSGPQPVTNLTAATFTFQSEAGATFECGLDTAPFTPCASPAAFAGLAEGTHRLAVRAVDAVGNVDATPSVFTWTVDLTPPAIVGLGYSPDVSPTSSTSFTGTFFSSEPNATYECRLDGAPFVACANPTTLTGLADGSHTFDVRAKDAAGNVGSIASRTWVIDTVAPDTSITGGPAGVVASNQATFTMGSTESPAFLFDCRLDGAAFASCGNPVTFTGLAEGAHTFEARARDFAGNVDATPASRTWTVDTVAPDTSITSGPSGTVASSSASIAFASEPGASFECRLDGAAFAACASPASLSGLAQGSHTFEVRARDAAGNVDASPAARTWAVDTLAPDTTIASGPSGAVSSTSATFTFSASEPATFECRIDGNAFTACVAGGITYLGGTQGSHTFEVRATDAVGNTDPTPASRTWIIDTIAPDTSITGGPSGNNNPDSATFTFASTEAGSTFECSLDGAAFSACASGIGYAGLAKGEHTFQVRAIDAAGNVDATPASRTWRVNK